MFETTYASLRENLASVMDRVVNDREVVVVCRKRGQPVAIIAADELSSLLGTAHILRSPKNARRLFEALRSSLWRKGRPEALDKVRQEMGVARPR